MKKKFNFFFLEKRKLGPCCYFTQGILSGIFTEIFCAEMVSVEVTCKTRGDNNCTMIIGHVTMIDDMMLSFLSENQFPKGKKKKKKKKFIFFKNE